MKIDKQKHSSDILLILIILGLFQYCDAPRNNPLDPGNPRTSVSRIKGYVQTARVPFNPVSGVTVFWEYDKVYTTTNSGGAFFINNITPRDGYLRFEKTGYITESFYVDWKLSNTMSMTQTLNACPKMDSLLVYTSVTNFYGARDTLTQLLIKAHITDLDNDIDTVYVKNNHLNINKILEYDPQDRFYKETITFSDLASLQKAVGYDFDIYVKDKYSHNIHVGGDKAVRVITDNFTLIFPSSYQIVPPTPKLHWNNFNPGYNFTWTIEIYEDIFPPTLVWEHNNITANDTSCIVDTLLNEGDYFWMIWCIDEFQNRARSKPVSFTVKE